MTTAAFSGPAGAGKTYQLMRHVESWLREDQLKSDESILALTYMHGSRRRLDFRLSRVPGLGSRFLCSTFDSFAWTLCRRWRSLLRFLDKPMPGESDYEQLCLTAAELLAHESVARWVASLYRCVVVDEFQDLTPSRLALFKGLATVCDCAVAADEFQCLNEELQPNPAMHWLSEHCTVSELSGNHRTRQDDLLTAALSVRSGTCLPATAQRCRVAPAKGKAFAATCVVNQLTWFEWRNVAIITPSTTGGFAHDVVELARSKSLGKRQNGPFPGLRWEESREAGHSALLDGVEFLEEMSAQEAVARLAQVSAHYAVRKTQAWIKKQHALSGRDRFSVGDIEDCVSRHLDEQRRFAPSRTWRLSAMTVHQAKNREFDGVIVLWPYTVAGGDEYKRRLLYNAITRARQWCLVIPQSEKLLADPPFAAAQMASGAASA